MENKLEELKEQLTNVINKRKEVSNELDRLTTIGIKLEGAIEVLEQLVEESKQKKEKKSA
jgi:chromosome segregation ATPase